MLFLVFLNYKKENLNYKKEKNNSKKKFYLSKVL